MRREEIKNFIELLIENHRRQKPFISIIDDMDLYQVIWETEDALAKALGIREDIMEYLIREYIYWVDDDCKKSHINDENNNKITNMDELLDCILRVMK